MQHEVTATCLKATNTIKYLSLIPLNDSSYFYVHKCVIISLLNKYSLMLFQFLTLQKEFLFMPRESCEEFPIFLITVL